MERRQGVPKEVNTADSNESFISAVSKSSEQLSSKRQAAKERIEQYYYQLTQGCGRLDCSNEYCASCINFAYRNITSDRAAVKAIELFRKKVVLCRGEEKTHQATQMQVDELPARVDSAQPSTSRSTTHNAPARSGQRTPSPAPPDHSSSETSMLAHQLDRLPTTDQSFISSIAQGGKKLVTSLSKQLQASLLNTAKVLTEELVYEVIDCCRATGDYSDLIRTIGAVFNNTDSLSQSFLVKNTRGEQMDTDQQHHPTTKMTRKSVVELSVDLPAVRRAYARLFDVPGLPFNGALMTALTTLVRDLEMELKYKNPCETKPNYLNVYMILLEIPVLFEPDYLDSVTGHFCKVVGLLPTECQAKLCQYWASLPDAAVWIKDKLNGLQQLVTVRALTTEWTSSHLPNDDECLTGTVKVLKLIYYTSMLLGGYDSTKLLEQERAEIRAMEAGILEHYSGAMGREIKDRNKSTADPLGTLLGVQPLNCRQPAIHWQEFVNEPLCDVIELDRDFTYFRTNGKFSFLRHSFILSTAVKNMGLYFDNRLRMIDERRVSLFDTLTTGIISFPFFKLRVRRDHIIDDALVTFEMAAMDSPQDLKKQLFVEFEGEQGIDEGGVSKEFFQLIVEEVFNANYGMFMYNEHTRQVWFNPWSFENERQFSLIGIVLGIAIYNNVILDVHFPSVVYRKLMGKKGTFRDLFDFNPVLARGLQQLLDYDGNAKDDFMYTFQVSTIDVFGMTMTHDLVPGGSEIAVTNFNRKDFVDRYSDFLLNKQVERQFTAFYRGFHMVTDESLLRVLFRPDEVELLVCGSKIYNFNELEQATSYDGGFTEHSSTIRYFWEVVHGFAEDQKRSLLQFTTGSDRVPVGGLKKLRLIIARNGPDSDRLPTAHTCFNVLLLPDYGNKQKLEERLLKAINYAQGFGML